MITAVGSTGGLLTLYSLFFSLMFQLYLDSIMITIGSKFVSFMVSCRISGNILNNFDEVFGYAENLVLIKTCYLSMVKGFF